MIGVYGITVNGMLVYIGKSIDLVSRRKQHWKAIFSAKDGKEKEIKYQCLAAAMDKHFSIEFKIIEECEVDILEDRETYYIQEYIPILNSKKTGHDIDITIDDFLKEIKKENTSFIKECNKNVLFLESIPKEEIKKITKEDILIAIANQIAENNKILQKLYEALRDAV